MKLFIWEGGGISTGYHDDGTLVVLAESVEQARRLALESASEAGEGNRPGDRWADGKSPYSGIYGPEEGDHNPAIDRQPDRVVELDTPRVVAWNGGGYD